MTPLTARAAAPGAQSPLDLALSRALRRLAELQRPDGHWPGDYGGPLFLLPGLLIAFEITGVPLSDHRRGRMIAYLSAVQNADGGWGLHVEDRTTVFGTALNYVALRILGLPPQDPRCACARAWLLDHGGAEGVPTWGKCWLAVLGVYDWEGLNPLLPELWLLPRGLPFHPGNLWCHTRAVFLPMSYLYGMRTVGPETPLVRALRQELYTRPLAEIDWRACRDRVHESDLYTPHSALLDALNRVFSAYERRKSRRLRRRALDFVLDQIRHEDESTGYLDIGPVSKAFHLLIAGLLSPGGPAFRRHVERAADYLWDGRDGMKMQGYNGSQFWDLAFAMQALLEDEPLARAAAAVLDRAHGWLDQNQVRANVPDHHRYFRSPTAGTFPFSTAEQAWSVSDCTAEGVKVELRMAARGAPRLSRERLRQAVSALLSEQNDDGGWSEYERSRGPRWLERLNAAEVFGDIMRGYSYVECTSACLQALRQHRAADPAFRPAEIDRAVARGLRFLRAQQRADGSFYGGWGICFSYGTWFAVEGLLCGGSGGPDLQRVLRACDFLAGRQRADGGLGESYRASVEKRWVEHERSQPVQSAWALLALLAAVEQGPPQAAQRYRTPIGRLVDFLLRTQTDDGWRHDMVYGVFNRNCMINYDNYRYYFPLWALARYRRLLGSGRV